MPSYIKWPRCKILTTTRRDDLERTCADYERNPAPILRHDPNISEQLTTSLAAPSGLSYRDKAELYRIQTEEAWGRWLWLVAELIPHGMHCVSGSTSGVACVPLSDVDVLPYQLVTGLSDAAPQGLQPELCGAGMTSLLASEVPQRSLGLHTHLTSMGCDGWECMQMPLSCPKARTHG